MKKLQMNTQEEEPLVWETVDAIQHVMLASQTKGLSLPGALKVLCCSIAQILATAYRDQKNRESVLSSVPDVIRALIPTFERLLARRLAEIGASKDAR